MGSCLDGGDVLCNDVSRVGSRMQESPLKAAQKWGTHEIFERAPRNNQDTSHSDMVHRVEIFVGFQFHD